MPSSTGVVGVVGVGSVGVVGVVGVVGFEGTDAGFVVSATRIQPPPEVLSSGKCGSMSREIDMLRSDSFGV